MLRIILAGCHGRMGTEISRFCHERPEISIVAGIDRTGRPTERYPVFSVPFQCDINADVLVDFSQPEVIHQLIPYCINRKLPIVLGVTGYSQQQLEIVQAACKTIPIFRAANLSIGANVLLKLTKFAAISLGNGFDADIIERHHKQKRDSPSGTALLLSIMLQKETAIKSIRSGSTAGEHTVLFAGTDEVLKLTHRADSRAVYAAGAIRAAHFIATAEHPGLYGMDDII